MAQFYESMSYRVRVACLVIPYFEPMQFSQSVNDFFTTQTVLVTGGAGFIGSHLVEELLSNEKEIMIFDNFLTGKKENLEIHGNPNVLTKDAPTSSLSQAPTAHTTLVAVKKMPKKYKKLKSLLYDFSHF